MSLQAKFEAYTRRNKHFPAKRIQYKDFSIYLSEGGPYYPDDFPLENRGQIKQDFPLGFYEATYAVGLGDEIIFWQPLCFDRLHNPDLTENARTQARINAAKEQAIKVIEDVWLNQSMISH